MKNILTVAVYDTDYEIQDSHLMVTLENDIIVEIIFHEDIMEVIIVTKYINEMEVDANKHEEIKNT
ncbi:hypothetical protein J5751_03005 [bacterium]|nr:hypothetical protein [bacterium]